MEDHLSMLLKSLEVSYSFIDDDNIILTCSTAKNVPTIIINRLFYKCPEKVAIAIKNFCLGTRQSEYNYKLIEQYAKENLFSLEYIISPPNDEFKSLLVRKSFENKTDKVVINKPQIISNKNLNDFTEMEIVRIECTDFSGTTKKLSREETTKTSCNCFKEFEITVLDSKL